MALAFPRLPSKYTRERIDYLEVKNAKLQERNDQLEAEVERLTGALPLSDVTQMTRDKPDTIPATCPPCDLCDLCDLCEPCGECARCLEDTILRFARDEEAANKREEEAESRIELISAENERLSGAVKHAAKLGVDEVLKLRKRIEELEGDIERMHCALDQAAVAIDPTQWPEEAKAVESALDPNGSGECDVCDANNALRKRIKELEAETIERCAKVVEKRAELWRSHGGQPMGVGASHLTVEGELGLVIADIRALNGGG